MKKYQKKTFEHLLMALAMVAGTTMTTGCNPEPDESDMYTITGETAADYIARKAELTSFNYILKRVGLDRNLASYGEYTCFAPVNDAISTYIDSLYNDTLALVPHNSMTANSLEGLSDSLCNDIARYHLANGISTAVEMGSGVNVRTMLGRYVQTETSVKYQGLVALEKEAAIIEPDSVVLNGVVHTINKVIPRSNRVITDELDQHGDYGIFMEALKLTGLKDSLKRSKKDVTYTITDINDNASNYKGPLYHPTECLIKYTIFAEPDVVLKPLLAAEGYSQDLNGLIQYANDKYKDAGDPAKGWYDYLMEKGLWNVRSRTYEKTVSTSDDYTSRNNALNMFVAYHILYAGMPQNELVFEQSPKHNLAWNYVNGCRPFDYYETMLPNTLMKIWSPQGNQLYINRWVANNTLTDQLGTLGPDGMGSESIHPIQRQGVRVARSTDANLNFDTNIQAYNGYIHGLRSILLYDWGVPNGVLHERLRFDTTTILPEFINNGIRFMNSDDASKLNGGKSGARVAFPLNYFDNVKSYTEENRLRYNIKGLYNAWQGDTFQGWGNYDLAVKMPPVPTGVYEFRIFYTPMSHGGMMMFYKGKSSSVSSMEPLDIPLDVRVPINDPRIGSTPFYEEGDYGIASDADLRNRGYMRGLYSYKDHVDLETVTDPKCATERNQRSDLRNASLRKILSRSLEIKQSEEFWLRIKNVIPDETDLKWQLDYIEFVPLDIVNSTSLSEDWF